MSLVYVSLPTLVDPVSLKRELDLNKVNHLGIVFRVSPPEMRVVFSKHESLAQTLDKVDRIVVRVLRKSGPWSGRAKRPALEMEEVGTRNGHVKAHLAAQEVKALPPRIVKPR